MLPTPMGISRGLRAPRRTHRVTITVPESVMWAVELRAYLEGRSVSNLVAVLLERELQAEHQGLDRRGQNGK